VLFVVKISSPVTGFFPLRVLCVLCGDNIFSTGTCRSNETHGCFFNFFACFIR
jgi:hypothetical protein